MCSYLFFQLPGPEIPSQPLSCSASWAWHPGQDEEYHGTMVLRDVVADDQVGI